MPPISRAGLFRAREIWIDDALCRAARCRRGALRQRRVAAIVIVGPPLLVYMQANRISRIVRLGPSSRRRQNRRDRQNRQSRNAHQSLLWKIRGARRSSRPKCFSDCVLHSGPGRILQIASKPAPLLPVNSRSRVGPGIAESRRRVALVDFEVVLAANLADIIDIGAHGLREYVRPSTNDFEPVGRQGLDHILLRERDIC